MRSWSRSWRESVPVIFPATPSLAHTLFLHRSTFVSTLTCGSSSCTMADSADRQPATNLGISAMNCESRQ